MSRKYNWLDCIGMGLELTNSGMRFVRDFDIIKRNWREIVDTVKSMLGKEKTHVDPGIIVTEKEEEIIS